MLKPPENNRQTWTICSATGSKPKVRPSPCMIKAAKDNTPVAIDSLRCIDTGVFMGVTLVFVVIFILPTNRLVYYFGAIQSGAFGKARPLLMVYYSHNDGLEIFPPRKPHRATAPPVLFSLRNLACM